MCNIVSCSPPDAVFISIRAHLISFSGSHPRPVESNLCYQMCSLNGDALLCAALLRNSVTDHTNYVGNKCSFVCTSVKRWRREFWLFIYFDLCACLLPCNCNRSHSAGTSVRAGRGGVRLPAKARNISSVPRISQLSSPPSLLPLNTGGVLTWVKTADALSTPSAEVKNVWSCTSTIS
jgi:hypothetical protein